MTERGCDAVFPRRSEWVSSSCWDARSLPCFLSRDTVGYAELAALMDDATGDGRPLQARCVLERVRDRTVAVRVEVGMAGWWLPLEDVHLGFEIVEMMADLWLATVFPVCDWSSVCVEYDSGTELLVAKAVHGTCSHVVPTIPYRSPDVVRRLVLSAS